MTLGDEHDEDSEEAGAIGVGMGGSCPSCRAPIDLGQEFCLECGAPIRFTPKQRQKRRPSSTPTSTATPTRRRSGFPWVPFLIVLALVGGGVALALVDGGGSSSKGKGSTSTEDALPTITNETQPTTQPSTTMTTTLKDCDPAQPLDGTVPAVPDDAQASTNEQIPSFNDTQSSAQNPDDQSAFDQPDATSGVPSIEPNEDSSTTPTVTVDQLGNLCPSSDAGTSTDPTTNTPSTNTPSTSSTNGTTANGAWPTGKSGWTAIITGYTTRERAEQRAADEQEKGYADTGILFSSDFTSLCPGYYVVFSGVFDTEDEAKDRAAELKEKLGYDAYAREVRTGGTPASGCKPAQ